MTTRSLSTALTLFILLGLAACTTAPQPPPTSQGLLPPSPESGTSLAPVIPGISLLVNGTAVSLEQLQAGGFGPDITVTVAAKSSTPYSEVADMLVKLHEMGYLVAFTNAD